jgi:hypothetical protein
MNNPPLFDYPYSPGFKERTSSQEAAILIHDSGIALKDAQTCLAGLQAGPATSKELSERVGLTLDRTRPRLTELKGQGKLEWRTDPRTGTWFRRDKQNIWFLAGRN